MRTVNRVVLVLALGGLLVGVVGVPVATSVAGPGALELWLGVAATALLLALGLGFLSGVGLAPLYDESGRYRAPATRREAGVRWLSLAASVALTAGLLGIGIPLLTNGLGLTRFGDADVPVIGAVIIGGIILALALAAVAGGIIVLGAAGVFAGVLLAAGVLVGALGVRGDDLGLVVAGGIGMAVAAGLYFAGARAHGLPFTAIGLGIPVGASAAYGLVLVVVAVVLGDAMLGLAGALAAATAGGYLAGGLRRRAAEAA